VALALGEASAAEADRAGGCVPRVFLRFFAIRLGRYRRIDPYDAGFL
jgi:hypothetical protein